MQTGSQENSASDWNVKADLALRGSLSDILAIEAEAVATFVDDTALFGALPELDSMAVATLLTDLEDRLHIVIDDEDVDLESFETFGNLRAMLAAKLEEKAG